MAHRHQPIPLIVAGEGDVGIARRERAALVDVDELCRSVAFGVVAVAVLSVGEETVALVGDETIAGAVAGVVVAVRLFRQARALELVGGVEREGARALGRGECRDPARGVEGVAVRDRRARRTRSAMLSDERPCAVAKSAIERPRQALARHLEANGWQCHVGHNL